MRSAAAAVTPPPFQGRESVNEVEADEFAGLVQCQVGCPGTSVILAASWLLSLLKLTGTRRVSHVDDLTTDPASALFAWLAILPKKSALTDYSYRLNQYQAEDSFVVLAGGPLTAGVAR